MKPDRIRPADVGAWGEEEACRYLKRQGYEIVMRNYRCGIGEIDIIARKDKILHFLEVKTRRGLAYGLPAEAVDRRKKAHITGCVKHYMVSNIIIDKDFQIDVIEILCSEGRAYLRHTENAFA